MKHALVHTLGCKVNQCESAALASLLDAAGFQAAGKNQTADVVVVNTCTVTGKAAMQSRQTIRQAIRRHPGAKIVVTGCYAQTAPAEIQSIEGVSLVVGHADKLHIAQMLVQNQLRSHAPQLVHRPIAEPHTFSPLPSIAPGNRTRAFLKIQDGCNAYCSYCIVPHARGRSRSMSMDEIRHHLQQLGALGYREVVLTGIHLGAYGRDFDPPLSLEALLSDIIPDCPGIRLRLSSIEPTEINDGILQYMAPAHPPVCPHLHIPLQSGDNTILKRMGRPYSRETFREVIQNAHRTLPQAAIGIDVLVGFPGESDSAFEQTYTLIEELPVCYLHVFPFSPRKGTPAAKFNEKVAEETIKARCVRLRQLGDRKKTIFYQSHLGKQVEVLVETAGDPLTGGAKGHSANYIPVIVRDGAVSANTIVSVRIEHMDEEGRLFGRKVPS